MGSKQGHPAVAELADVRMRAAQQAERYEASIQRQVRIIDRLLSRLAAHDCKLGPQCPDCAKAGIDARNGANTNDG